jgi:hypothetical protein
MARDGGWQVESIEEAAEAAIEEFQGPGRDFYRRAQAEGVFMVLYTWPAEASRVETADRTNLST